MRALRRATSLETVDHEHLLGWEPASTTSITDPLPLRHTKTIGWTLLAQLLRSLVLAVADEIAGAGLGEARRILDQIGGCDWADQ